jgi:outer membrane protein
MKTITTLRATAIVALTAASTAVLALDLIGSYRKALDADPTIRAADHAALAGREKAVQGGALLKPRLSLSASYTHVSDESSTSLSPQFEELIKSDSSGNVYQLSVRVAQPLYNAKLAAERKQLEEFTELSEVSHRHAQQDLIERVGEAYFGVLLAEESLRVVRAEKAAVGLQRDRSQARFDVGRGKITEVQEAQARYDGVLANEVSALSNLDARQAQYRELTGVPAVGLAELRAGFSPAPPQPADLQAWQARARERNVRVQAKQHELVIATAEVDKYKLASRPSVQLVGSYAVRGQNGGLSATISPDTNRTLLVGAQLRIPLYDGGGMDSRERESIERKYQAKDELGAAERDARLHVQDRYLAVTTGIARIAALEQSVRSAQTALEATTLARDVGTRTDLDVLDAQQRWYSLQLDLARARNDYLLGRIGLASAAGELTVDVLHALNAYLVN